MVTTGFCRKFLTTISPSQSDKISLIRSRTAISPPPRAPDWQEYKFQTVDIEYSLLYGCVHCQQPSRRLASGEIGRLLAEAKPIKNPCSPSGCIFTLNFALSFCRLHFDFCFPSVSSLSPDRVGPSNRQDHLLLNE